MLVFYSGGKNRLLVALAVEAVIIGHLPVLANVPPHRDRRTEFVLMKKFLRRRLWLKIALVWFCMGPLRMAWSDSPRVVVSIKPVHALVSGVMGATGKPELLVKGAASPHAYTLRPSDVSLLHRAELIFWVGEDYETFLGKPLGQRAVKARVVALHRAPGIRLLPNRKGMGSELADGDQPGHISHLRAGEESIDHHEDHRHGTMDMHIWLDPANAQAMVAAIRQALEQADPDHAENYRENAARIDTRIQNFALEAAQRLAAVKGKSFIVFHDAYHYFENYFGLSSAGFLTVHPERPASARRLAAIREIIKNSGVTCVFSEPQFEPALVETVTRGSSVKKGVLDPLGGDGLSGEEGWFSLMDDLIVRLSACLTSP